MRKLIVAAALASSIATFLLTFAVGVGLAAIIQSGERLAGLVIVLASLAALAAALFLVFVSQERYRGPAWRPVWAAITLIAALPVAAVAAGAIYFVGVPVGSLIPRLDWTLFVVGIALAIGAIAIVAAGLQRLAPGVPRRAAETPLTAPLRPIKERANPAYDADDDVRVTQA